MTDSAVALSLGCKAPGVAAHRRRMGVVPLNPQPE
jgi:hypothetical protein